MFVKTKYVTRGCMFLVVLLFLTIMAPIHAYAEQETRDVQIKIQVEDFDPSDMFLFSNEPDKYIVVRLHDNDHPPGHIVEEHFYHFAHLVNGSFNPIINIPVPDQSFTTDEYHIRVAYAKYDYPQASQIHEAFISIKITKSNTQYKNSGSWYPLYNYISVGTPTINIPVPGQEFLNPPLGVTDPGGFYGSAPYNEVPDASMWGDPKPDNTILAKMFTRLVKDFMGTLWNFFGIQDPITLFFNVDPEILFENFAPENMEAKGMGFLSRPDNSMYVDPTAEETFLYTFNDREYTLINLMFNEFNKFLQIPYAVAIALVGFLLFIKGYSSEDRSTIKVFLGSILFFPLLIKIVPYILEPLFWLNFIIVRAVGSTLESGLGIPLTDPFVATLIGSGTALNSIGVIIGTFFLFAAVGLLNFQYYIRRFMLAILIMMFPIVAFLQVFPTNRNILRMWFSEFMANLFLQSAHAIVYLVFAGLVYHIQAPFIPVMAMLITLSTFSGFVRNLMGCQSNSSMAGNMLGISALYGAGRITSNIMNGVTGKGGETEKAKAISQASSRETSSHVLEQTPEQTSEQSAVLSSQAGQATKQNLTTKEPAGIAWGIAPRMNLDYKGLLKRAGTGAIVGGTMAAGSIVGASAAGSAGFGFGAMAGAKTSEYMIKGGSYAGNVAGNIADRESKIRDIQQKMNMDRSQAIVYTATGVEASEEEVIFDKGMSDQVINFCDVAGFSDITKKMKSYHTEFARNTGKYLKEGNSIRSVRDDAAQLRASLTEQGLSAPEINRCVLDEIIRPAMKPKPSLPVFNMTEPLAAPSLPGAYESESKNALANKPWYHYTNDENDNLEQDSMTADNYSNSMRIFNNYWEWAKNRKEG